MVDALRRSAYGTALAVAIIFGAGVRPARAAQSWISVNTAHFELYTDNSAREARRALAEFEQVRSFFLEMSRLRNAGKGRESESPVRIIAFRSEREFAPYRINPGVFAYYQRSRQRDYIVMQDVSPAHYPVAVHEYTHLIMQHAGLNLPVWLNEGLADLYSSLEPEGDRTMIGRPLASECQVLNHEPWLSFAVMTGVTPQSPYYNEQNKMSIFYAQSWLLAHMLALSAGYGPRFPEFVAAVSGGKPAAEALAAVYGKSASQVDLDLRAYFRQSTVRASILPIKLVKADLNPDVQEISPFDRDLAMADLLASHRSTAGDARRLLTQLAARQPGNPRVRESLGYLSWQEGDSVQAQIQFAAAFRSGSVDANMLYHYASLVDASGGDREEAIRALALSLQLNPAFEKARLALGMELMAVKRYGPALSALSEIRTVKPDQAFSVFSSLAYCNLQLNNPQNARLWELKAARYASKPSEREQVATFVRYLDRLDKSMSAAAAGSR